jgi:hypothetical protein
MNISMPGIDLGKDVRSIAGLDATGAAVLRRRAKREALVGLAAKLCPLSSPWKLAVARIISGGYSPLAGTRCG